MPRRIVSVEELSIVSVVVKFCFVGKTVLSFPVPNLYLLS